MFNLQLSHFQKYYLSFFLLFSSYTFKTLDKCITLDWPLKHKQNVHSCHVKFFRLYTSFNMVKNQPKLLSNCEGKITMRLFCQNARVVELGFIENFLARFILNPFILVYQHQVDIPCSRCLGTISHIKGVEFENQVCD
jgi:hypothetical protein